MQINAKELGPAERIRALEVENFGSLILAVDARGKISSSSWRRKQRKRCKSCAKNTGYLRTSATA